MRVVLAAWGRALLVHDLNRGEEAELTAAMLEVRRSVAEVGRAFKQCSGHFRTFQEFYEFKGVSVQCSF